MKIAFYKGFSGNIFDKLISIWTLHKYSHVEIVDSNNVSYSSSPRDGGVRKKNIDYNNDKWDLYDIHISNNSIENIMTITNGRKYDWIGIFLYHFLPFKIQDKDRWYCSEWVATVLNDSGYSIKTNLTPGNLFKQLKSKKIIK
jgi:hypothetical protein